MEETSNRFLIRPARAEDRGPVLAFCVDTFAWGDYIADVWDDWLAASDGQLMVAEIAGVPVALQHVSFPSATEAWLQGMRVDPAVRQQGIATALFQAGMTLVRERGARVVRLMTKVENGPVHRMMEIAGFRRLNTYTERRAPADHNARQTPETAVSADLDDLWRLAEDSEGFKQGDRTHIWDWRCFELTRQGLADHLEQRHVFVTRQQGRPAAMALVEWWADDKSLWVGTVYGGHEPVRRLGLALRVHAARLGAPEVMAYVPYADGVVDALGEAGYRSRPEEGVPDMELFVRDFPTP
jgi:GNAT superfamily N-acetyltransferase